MLPPKRSTRSTRATSYPIEVVPKEGQESDQNIPEGNLPQPTDPCSTHVQFFISTPRNAEKAHTTHISLLEKKTRRKLTTEQRLALEDMASRETNPSLENRRALAEELGLELKVVSVWFQNKRRPSNRLQESLQVTPVKTRGVGLGRVDQGSRRILSDVIDNATSLENGTPLRVVPDHTVEEPDATISIESVGQQTIPGIWDLLPSSPPGPTPDASQSEESILEAVVSESPNLQTKRRSLEWACLNDRRATKRSRIDFDSRVQVSPEPLPLESTPQIQHQRADRKPQGPSARFLNDETLDSQVRNKSHDALFHSISFDDCSLLERDVLDVALALILLKGDRPLRKSL